MNDKSATPPPLTVMLNEAGSAGSTAHTFRSVEEAVLHCLERKKPPAPDKIEIAAPGNSSILPAPQ
ncbi:hypothetical protein [Xanthobacter autotrophicus]|uniref:hypothetical protein n=1 Tax=Xanthobacter autotrophicus TaxID=280 RepID=UPI003728D58E